MIGKVYGIPPQPPQDSQTTYLEGGPISIGVEYRVVDQAALRETYKDDPAQLEELERESPAGGFAAEGLSLHVVLEGHEYLRFDLFDDPPHYHYVHPVNAEGEHRQSRRRIRRGRKWPDARLGAGAPAYPIAGNVDCGRRRSCCHVDRSGPIG